MSLDFIIRIMETYWEILSKVTGYGFFCGLWTEKNKVRSQNISLDVTEAVMTVQKRPGGSLDQNKSSTSGERFWERDCSSSHVRP